MTTFQSFALSEPILSALGDLGYEVPTPIQEQAIPPLLEGRDLLGSAQTGTGKTAAFGLPMLEHLGRRPGRARKGAPRALILTPTRELAIQVHDNLEAYGANLRLRFTCIYGGVSQKRQTDALARGVEVLTATPGRLLDLCGQGFIDLSSVEFFVLDEADRMLDMGFLPDVRRVLEQLPEERQNLFFSATMPPAIVDLSGRILTDPVHVEIVPESTTADGVTQRVMFVDSPGKKKLIVDLAKDERVKQALVFTRTKHRANRVAKLLDDHGVRTAAIHGNKSQNARQRALGGFREGTIRVLVATDIAARGIDVEGITHVINFDVPVEPEAYVHRIGRTARAGATGMALTFCDRDEIDMLRAIESLIGNRVPVAGDRIGLPDHVVNPGDVQAGRRRAPARRPSSRKRKSRGRPGRSR